MTQSKPKAVIFDIDGTLADVEHRRHFVNGSQKKDWRSFYESCVSDPVKENVRTWLDVLALRNRILLVSGRPEDYRPQTEAWMKEHDIPFNRLFMRPANNYERDTIIKERIYRQDIEPNWTVELVIDDRTSVVKMWRSIGLECWQVAEGDF